MRYTPSTYAQALLATYSQVPATKHAGVIKRFWALVRKNGDMPRAEKIVKAVERFMTHQSGGRMITIECARDISKALLSELRNKFKAHDSVQVKINPALVAGVRVTLDGEQELDQSLQRKLNNLFHHGV